LKEEEQAMPILHTEGWKGPMTGFSNLPEIVASRDLKKLEQYCLFLGTYQKVRDNAVFYGIDLGELEDLLAEI